MRLIKLAVVSFVVLFAIITAMSLLIPSHVRISRAVNFKSGTPVFKLITDQSQWRRWHPAFQSPQIDSLLSEHRIRIETVSATDTLIAMNWLQAGKAPVLNSWELHSLAASDSVALQWYMDFHLKWYPWQKFGSLLYEKTYGSLMEQGLQNIKHIAQ